MMPGAKAMKRHASRPSRSGELCNYAAARRSQLADPIVTGDGSRLLPSPAARDVPSAAQACILCWGVC
jgi:hypothetical protein